MRVPVLILFRSYGRSSQMQVIVEILPRLRRQTFQNSFHVLQKARFIFVDYYGCSRVSGLDIQQTVRDARIFQDGFDLISEIYEFKTVP